MTCLLVLSSKTLIARTAKYALACPPKDPIAGLKLLAIPNNELALFLSGPNVKSETKASLRVTPSFSSLKYSIIN